VALVVQALLRIAGRTVKDRVSAAVAMGAFALMAFTLLPFPLVILAAGAVGWLLGGKGQAAGVPVALVRPGGVRVALVCLAAWLAPICLAWAIAPGSPLAWMGLTFGGLAAISFGGAYAALAYLGQAAAGFGWLSASQMLDGLGLAETTPGPLVLVFVFVGFVGAFQTAPPDSAWLLAVLGGLMAAWTTFAPSFLWIFAGGPWIERWGRQPRPGKALAMVSAAAVGVIGQLALWFTIHLLFRSGRTAEAGALRLLVPDLAAVNPGALGLVILALGLTFAMRIPMLAMIAVTVGVAVLLRVIGFN
jgi:chromate transporter